MTPSNCELEFPIVHKLVAGQVNLGFVLKGAA